MASTHTILQAAFDDNNNRSFDHHTLHHFFLFLGICVDNLDSIADGPSVSIIAPSSPDQGGRMLHFFATAHMHTRYTDVHAVTAPVTVQEYNKVAAARWRDSCSNVLADAT